MSKSTIQPIFEAVEHGSYLYNRETLLARLTWLSIVSGVDCVTWFGAHRIVNGEEVAKWVDLMADRATVDESTENLFLSRWFVAFGVGNRTRGRFVSPTLEKMIDLLNSTPEPDADLCGWETSRDEHMMALKKLAEKLRWKPDCWHTSVAPHAALTLG